MTRFTAAFGLVALLTIVVGGCATTKGAGEADDLQVMIERARNGAADLERLDERNAAREEITILRVWLDEAWRLRSNQKYDDVRVVLDRCDAQAEMIRQKVQASKVLAEATAKEQAARQVQQDIETTKKAIQDATLQKAGLEGRAKK
jgi:predicted small secreted protein